MDADRIVDQYHAGLGEPANVLAFIMVCRLCEGVATEEGYRALYGWKPGRDDRLFTSFADHPRRRFWIRSGLEVARGESYGPGETTTAAGAPQVNVPTWSDFIAATWPHDFSPQSQNECFVWLFKRDHAYADILSGDLDAALRKCSGTWASLPFSTAGQPTRNVDYALQAYLDNGGALDTTGVGGIG